MYSIVRFKTIKRTNSSSAAANARLQIIHDFRLGNEQYADPDKLEENRVLYLNEQLLTAKDGSQFIPFKKDTSFEEPKINFKKVFDEHIEKNCGKDYNVRSNAIHALEIMMTASSNRPEGFDEDGWAKDSLKWCEDKFGKENIVFAVLHRDETTPHIHVQLIPTYDGVLNASKHIGKMEKNRELDRSYYEAVKKYGFEKRKNPLHKKHVSVAEFRRRVMQASQEPIPEPQKKERPEDYYKRIKEWAETHNAQAFVDIQRRKEEIREAMVDLRMERRLLDEKDSKVNTHKKDYEDMEALRYMMKSGVVLDEQINYINSLIKEGRKQMLDMSKNAGLEGDKEGYKEDDTGRAGNEEGTDR